MPNIPSRITPTYETHRQEIAKRIAYFEALLRDEPENARCRELIEELRAELAELK